MDDLTFLYMRYVTFFILSKIYSLLVLCQYSFSNTEIPSFKIKVSYCGDLCQMPDCWFEDISGNNWRELTALCFDFGQVLGSIIVFIVSFYIQDPVIFP